MHVIALDNRLTFVLVVFYRTRDTSEQITGQNLLERYHSKVTNMLYSDPVLVKKNQQAMAKKHVYSILDYYIIIMVSTYVCLCCLYDVLRFY